MQTDATPWLLITIVCWISVFLGALIDFTLPNRVERKGRETQQHSLPEKGSSLHVCIFSAFCPEMLVVLLQFYSVVRCKWQFCARDGSRKYVGYTGRDATCSMKPQAEVIV